MAQESRAETFPVYHHCIPPLHHKMKFATFGALLMCLSHTASSSQNASTASAARSFLHRINRPGPKDWPGLCGSFSAQRCLDAKLEYWRTYKDGHSDNDGSVLRLLHVIHGLSPSPRGKVFLDAEPNTIRLTATVASLWGDMGILIARRTLGFSELRNAPAVHVVTAATKRLLMHQQVVRALPQALADHIRLKQMLLSFQEGTVVSYTERIPRPGPALIKALVLT